MISENREILLGSTVKRNPNQEFSSIDDEIIMLSVQEGKYLAFNDVASRIWELLENPVTVKEIVNILVSEYEIGVDECTNDVISCLNDFNKRLLLEQGD